jgi:hypothetical protein
MTQYYKYQFELLRGKFLFWRVPRPLNDYEQYIAERRRLENYRKNPTFAGPKMPTPRVYLKYYLKKSRERIRHSEFGMWFHYSLYPMGLYSKVYRWLLRWNLTEN